MKCKIGRTFLIIFLLILITSLFTACETDSSGTVQSLKTPSLREPTNIGKPIADDQILATPYAQSPAAGICPEVPPGETAAAEIYPDIPSPRCLIVSPEQELALVNRTEEVLLFRLGHYEAEIHPGETFHLEIPFDSYLLPGVHVPIVSPFSGPEIFLIAE